MDTIKVVLHTPQDGFANELCDVLKLFFVVEEWQVNSEADENAEIVTHTYEECGERAVCTLIDIKVDDFSRFLIRPLHWCT